MGAVGGLLGLNGGAGGTGFASPKSATILNPTTTKQAQTAYDANQQALAQQQGLVNALAAQNGLANQSSVYNQLQNIANGQGPNPAQAMLANATGQNVANQAALMAGQRGSTANPGMIARQAAQQGANTQQQAAGQGAALQAQQSLGALQGLGNLATTQAGQQIQGVQGLTQAQQNEQQQLLNSIAQQNNANVGMQSNINQANAGLAQTQMGGINSLLGGAGNAIGAGIGKLFKAEGGKIEYADGGQIDPNAPSSFTSFIMSQKQPKMAEGGKVPAMVSPGEQYLPPKDVEKVKAGANPMEVGEKIPGKPKVPGAKNDYANDTVPKNLDEGGIVIPRSITQGKNPGWESMKFVHAHMAKGGKVPKKSK